MKPQNRPGAHMPKGESLTQKHFAQNADINHKVAKHLRSIPGANLSNIGQGGTRQPIFGDFTRIDYQDMLNKVTDIDQQFNALPGRIRNRFRNRPDQLLAFLEDPKNLKRPSSSDSAPSLTDALSPLKVTSSKMRTWKSILRTLSPLHKIPWETTPQIRLRSLTLKPNPASIKTGAKNE